MYTNISEVQLTLFQQTVENPTTVTLKPLIVINLVGFLLPKDLILVIPH
jgi:hypothetical protein